MNQSDTRPALNVLRGLAAVVIVIYHFRHFSDFAWFEAMPWLKSGFMGVDFFFILSGLIISHVYLNSMGTGRQGYLHFLYLRIARIFPVHFLLMAAMIAFSMIFGPRLGTISDWFSVTFLYRQMLLPDGYAWNAPSWSVSAEMFAYAIIFPFVVAAAKYRNRKTIGRIFVIAGACILAVLYDAAGTLNETKSLGPLLRVTGCFLIGAGLHCLLAHKRMAEEWDKVIIAGAVLLAFSIWIQTQFAILASICVIIAGAYLSNGPVSARMSGRYPYMFGEISFSLYMCHVPLFMLFNGIAIELDVERGMGFCAFALGCSIALAWVLYTFVEVPARTGLRKLWTAKVEHPSLNCADPKRIESTG